MKQLIALLVISVFLAPAVNGQSITYDDFRTLIPFLEKEDFKGAFEKSNGLLNATENDSSDLRGIVMYMNIYSAAAMVSQDQMTHDDFQKNANRFTGQRLVMSAHPCTDSLQRGFNSVQFVTREGVLQGMTIVSNKTRTSIFCFEYFKYDETINPADYIGKDVRNSGILEKVEVNPNKSTTWIARLYITNASIRVLTP